MHGYHPFVEDAEIYVPGIKQLLNPSLYPYNDAFFSSHAKLTLFPNLIAASVRLTHTTLEWGLLLWHVGCIFSLLLACWKLGQVCFGSSRAAWGSALLVASLLTIPVAGTALYIMDQYLNTRSFATVAAIWIVLAAIQRKYGLAALWILLAAMLHPLMAGFTAFFALLLIWQQRSRIEASGALTMVLPAFFFPPVTSSYRQVLDSRPYFFLLRWQWYEWLGIVGPVIILWFLGRAAGRKNLHAVETLWRATVGFVVLFVIAALALSVPQLARFAELQPMRSLHLVYILLFAISGGWLADWIFGSQRNLRLPLFAGLLTLNVGMFYVQQQLFPATPHVEWPGRSSQNPWVQAFLWVREHTPTDAYFALDPDHMRMPGEDQHGFRAIAERSMLADRIKDSGAVSMFSALSETWADQVHSLQGWSHFQLDDFELLRTRYGVDWVVVQQPDITGLECPYANASVLVCRIPRAPQATESQ